MAYISKEQFEEMIKSDYEALDKKGFAILINDTKAKLMELIKSGDIQLEKTDDDYELTGVSKPFYEIAFNTYQFVARTRKMSLKQYKCLSALVGKKPSGMETQFKQF